MISKLNRLLLFSAVMAVSMTGCALAVSQEEREFYIQGTSGPYRGRVIDAHTKQPIPEAMVVAAWYHDVYALVQNNEQFYDAVEVLTDDRGDFVVDAPDIERRAPWRTKFPVFTIFKPGYKYYRGWFASEKEMAQRRQRSLLGIVELEPIDFQNKRERLRNLPPRDLSVPSEKIPIFLKILETERQMLLR
jgi:hypothetical protein